MLAPYSGRSALILIVASLLTSQVLSQCNTNQNPYCAGQSKFEQLCCPYPAVCYWTDRSGTPGCCQPGQVCVGNGNGVTITPTLLPVTPPATTQTVGTPLATTPNGGYATLTVTGGVAGNTPAAYTTTAGVIVANDASQALRSVPGTYFSLGLAVLAWSSM